MSSIATYEIDVDSLQHSIFERAGRDPDEPVKMATLARELGYSVRVVRPAPFRGDGAFARLHGEGHIFIRGGIEAVRQAFACAHEIAEAELLRAGVEHEQLEDIANAAAAALLAPRRSFIRRHNAVGNDWEQLALPYNVTQTAAALRAGETEDQPLAVVAKVTRTRGPEDFVWPAESVIRSWARRAPRGLAKARLTDDRSRVVLVAEDRFGYVG